ncbi:MAG TPA: hypothetical protein PK511_08585 [Chitinophagales bacterium]|nr:hypothetical protein [Chitinophagales bacterium]HMU69072.1 hypothetical protein [Chitinophagales bacterium]HMX03433.1 hypothetical protein [Chitinophagales bacterium]HMZ88142.1 hypothetical protein [Chitinophagales bacterium]HNA58322.1 hypothetical protein [Chitinophagales bacterium]
MSLFDNIKKEEVEIIATVKKIEIVYTYKGDIQKITLICDSEKLKKGYETYFNYSTKWSKFNLKSGDKLKFKAILKTTTVTVHKDERWVDDWGTLPIHLTDMVDFIEIQSPKQIMLF